MLLSLPDLALLTSAFTKKGQKEPRPYNFYLPFVSPIPPAEILARGENCTINYIDPYLYNTDFPEPFPFGRAKEFVRYPGQKV